MSDRLTSDWTDDSEGAFGETGRIGDAGELLAIKLFEHLGIEYIHYKSNQEKQNAGWDFGIRISGIWYGVDIKTNILDTSKPDVCIEWTALKKSKATFWLHINSADHLQDFIMYKVRDMKKYIIDNKITIFWYNGKQIGFVPKVDARIL